MSIGLYRLGGSSVSCLNCNNKKCLLPMNYSGNWNNDNYYKPGNRASWARRSRPSGKKNISKIGVNRLG